jgi:hypothetical protein
MPCPKSTSLIGNLHEARDRLAEEISSGRLGLAYAICAGLPGGQAHSIYVHLPACWVCRPHAIYVGIPPVVK